MENYKNTNNNIYKYLVNTAKCKYLRGNGVKEYQEKFFIDFIIGGKTYNLLIYYFFYIFYQILL